MATAPQISTRDGGSSAQNVVFSTNRDAIFLEGTVDAQTVDLQVSVNGGPFISDPSLVLLDSTAFTIPDPAAHPEGLPLEFGENTIRLRAIDIVGGVSGVSTATVTKVLGLDGLGELTPSGIRVRRRRNAVDILAVKPSALVGGVGDSAVSSWEFRGFNFYASSSPAGTTGYIRVNERPVTEVSTVFEEDLLDIDTLQTVFPALGDVRIRVTQEDSLGGELSLVADRFVPAMEYSGQLKFTGVLQSRGLTEFVFFRHNRAGGTNTINSDQFADLNDSDLLYYVVSAIYYDPETGTEVETPFSQEVLGKPLVIDTSIRDLPGRNQLQVSIDFVKAIQRVDSEIELIPGSSTRDVSIDPFASEAERLWFIVDFVHRSGSFLTLLQIDDANGDGVSDPVATSAYKQALKAALGFQTDAAVQQLIDAQFDKLAGNHTKIRQPGRPAVGQVVFFTPSRPTQDVVIASGTVVTSDADPENGIPSVRFIVGGSYILPAADADAYYNFDTQRYEVTADIFAESIGEEGNRPAGSIRNIVSPVGGMQVTNTEATVFGLNREGNAGLAERAQLALVSVDSGTEGGYAATAAEQIGILKSKIVKSGDPLMMRDYDEVRRKHIGGKVDIWVQGLKERTLTERFAFTFEVARDIRVQVLDAVNLIFRVLDSRVTENSPIVEILDNPSQGFGVRNTSIAQDYNLTGVTILDYQTFQLNTAVAQPVTNADDIITADYRFRAVNQFTFSLQPVRRVVSVVGESSGTLDPVLGYSLFKTDDPLLEGESTIAKDYMIVHQVGGVPSGGTISVSDEEHVLIGLFEEPLGSIGINTATIRVFDESRMTEYAGPDEASPDYEVIPGTATTPAKIVRTASSLIVSGQPVSVDYDHDENFTVTYVINDLLQQLQRTINSRRHITADVLVKQAIQNSMAIETTVQLKRGASKDKTDPAIRTNVTKESNTKLIGEGYAQSDMIQTIDATEGVDFQVLPLAKMGYVDGARKLREPVLPTSTRVPSLDIGGNQVFVLNNPLNYPTTDGGGLLTEHRGVFQDDEPFTLATALELVGQSARQAYIIGSAGAIIAGYSDDATIVGAGFSDPEDIEAERLRRTANHVLVSLSGSGVPPDQPENHSYAVSYVVRGDRGPHDILVAPVETVDLGELTLTFRGANSS